MSTETEWQKAREANLAANRAAYAESWSSIKAEVALALLAAGADIQLAVTDPKETDKGYTANPRVTTVGGEMLTLDDTVTSSGYGSKYDRASRPDRVAVNLGWQGRRSFPVNPKTGKVNVEKVVAFILGTLAEVQRRAVANAASQARKATLEEVEAPLRKLAAETLGSEYDLDFRAVAEDKYSLRGGISGLDEVAAVEILQAVAKCRARAARVSAAKAGA